MPRSILLAEVTQRPRWMGRPGDAQRRARRWARWGCSGGGAGFGLLAGPGVRRRRQGHGPVSEVRRASGRCAGRGPGQEPDYARRPLSAGTPALRGQARPTRNPRAVTDPHPAHTPDTYGAWHKVHEGLATWARTGEPPGWLTVFQA